MPTRDTPWPSGTPCWVDYGAADLDATKAFYASVLGWEYSGGEPEFGGYLTVMRNGRMAGGMGPQQDPDDPPRWTTYFAADDAAATAAKIKDAGGRVLVEPMQVGPMGTMVIALDPQGNPFGLWQSGFNTGVQIHNEPGALAWNEAMSTTPGPRRSSTRPSSVSGSTRWTPRPPARAVTGRPSTTPPSAPAGTRSAVSAGRTRSSRRAG
jgi:uncharacterized protein